MFVWKSQGLGAFLVKNGRGIERGGDPLRQERGLSSATGMPAQWLGYLLCRMGKGACLMEASAGQLWKQACEKL